MAQFTTEDAIIEASTQTAKKLVQYTDNKINTLNTKIDYIETSIPSGCLYIKDGELYYEEGG